MKPASNSISNETPTAGVKSAAAKSIQIKERTIENPIAILIIGTSMGHNASHKQRSKLDAFLRHIFCKKSAGLWSQISCVCYVAITR